MQNDATKICIVSLYHKTNSWRFNSLNLDAHIYKNDVVKEKRYGMDKITRSSLKDMLPLLNMCLKKHCKIFIDRICTIYNQQRIQFLKRNRLVFYSPLHFSTRIEFKSSFFERSNSLILLASNDRIAIKLGCTIEEILKMIIQLCRGVLVLLWFSYQCE